MCKDYINKGIYWMDIVNRQRGQSKMTSPESQPELLNQSKTNQTNKY